MAGPEGGGMITCESKRRSDDISRCGIFLIMYLRQGAATDVSAHVWACGRVDVPACLWGGSLAAREDAG